AASGEERPLRLQPLEPVVPTDVELEPGAGHQVTNRAGGQDLAGSGGGRHTRRDVHRNASEIAVVGLALPSVEPRPNVDAEVRHGAGDRLGAADATCGSVEGGHETVAGVLHLASPVRVELPPDDRVVLRQQLMPGAVAKAPGMLSR